jgi:hypothetical protein
MSGVAIILDIYCVVPFFFHILVAHIAPISVPATAIGTPKTNPEFPGIEK